MTEQLLEWLTIYGLSALFGILVISAIGAPIPSVLLLVASGSFVAQGEMKLWHVLFLASAGAIFGDQIGYCLGRYGGRGLVYRIATRFGDLDKIKRAEGFSNRWGGVGVFLSRWLVTPLGPWLNLTCGITLYSWPRFFLWDVVGEVLWVVIYVMLGNAFSDRVQTLIDLLGNLTWVITGASMTIILGWKVFQYFRNSGSRLAQR